MAIGRSNLIAMASNLVATACNLVATASNLVAMASNLGLDVFDIYWHSLRQSRRCFLPDPRVPVRPQSSALDPSGCRAGKLEPHQR